MLTDKQKNRIKNVRKHVQRLNSAANELFTELSNELELVGDSNEADYALNWLHDVVFNSHEDFVEVDTERFAVAFEDYKKNTNFAEYLQERSMYGNV